MLHENSGQEPSRVGPMPRAIGGPPLDLVGKRFGRLGARTEIRDGRVFTVTVLPDAGPEAMDAPAPRRPLPDLTADVRSLLTTGEGDPRAVFLIRRRSSPINDRAGRRYGLLTAVRWTGQLLNGKAVWLCRCDCGREVEVAGNRLTRASSCGCGSEVGAA